MKVVSVLLVVFLYSSQVSAQAVFTTTGFWETALNWSGSNIGDDIAENVTINPNRAALINNGSVYTIGDLTFGGNTGLTINSTGVLNVGENGTPKILTAGNLVSVTVAGQLTVWGDLIVLDDLSLNVAGSLIVKGNIQMSNDASISVMGNVEVDGDFTAGNNTNVSIVAGGHIDVAGTVTVGDNSNLLGLPGSFTAGGCSEGSGSTFCTSGTLPVDLLYFRAEPQVDHIRLVWETASELNADYFQIEKSTDGLNFDELNRIPAAGNSTERIRYELRDEKPHLGKSYYRLKQADTDGAVRVFSIVLVDFTGLRSSIVYPSPWANGNDLTLELNFNPQYPLEVVLHDLSGRVVDRALLHERSATWPVKLDAGVYVVRITSPEYKGVNKFLVR